MKEIKDFIIKDIVNSSGSIESSRLYAIISIKTGDAELVIEKTISERHPMQDYSKVMDLYERLNCGGGRKLWTLEEIAHPYNPN